MITQEELARRLRLARGNVGLSQEAVAAELGVPRPTISQIESGKRGVSSLELNRLARLYRYPMAAFFGEDAAEGGGHDALTGFLRAAEFRPEDRQVVEAFAEVCRAYADLETLLGVADEAAVPDYGEVGEPRTKFEAIQQGERVAGEERHRLSLGDDPIRDICGLLESQGVRLVVRPLRDSQISGLYLYDRSLGPCILINGTEPRHRLAFNAAHEYAHVLFDRRRGAKVSATSQQLREPERHAELIEVRATSFAAAFLMPSVGIEWFLWGRGVTRSSRHPVDVLDVLYLQRTFGLSYQAALYRLQNLGWLGREQREVLARHRPEALARALGAPDEADADRAANRERAYPFRYVYLALEAYRQAKISLGKLAELLGQNVADARELVWDLGAPVEAATSLAAV